MTQPEYATTWVMPDATLEGKLLSRVNVIAWRLDDEEQKLVDPTQFVTYVPMRLPFFDSKSFIVREQLQEFKDSLRRDLNKKLSENVRPEVEPVITSFLTNINTNIRIQEMVGPEKVSHLILPPYNIPAAKRIFQNTLQFSKYHLYQMQAEEALNFPFGTFSIINGRIQLDNSVVPYEYILNSKKIAHDSEADNWQKQKASAHVRAMNFEDLSTYFATIAPLDPRKEAQKKAGTLTRREMLVELDLIADHFKTKGERQSLHINMSDDGGVFFGEYPFPKIVDVLWPGKNKSTRFTCDGTFDSEGLVSATEKHFATEQPLIIFGQNSLKYDYVKPKLLHGHFRIGTHGQEVKHRGQIQNGFIVRKEVPGRLSQDNMGFSQHFLSLQRNSLDMQHQYFTGCSDKKVLNYEQLFVIGKKALDGDIEALKILGIYGGQDVQKTWDNCMATLEAHIHEARISRSLPGRIDTVSKKQRHIEYWMRKFYEHHHRFTRDIAMYPFTSSTNTKTFTDFDGRAMFDKQLGEFSKLTTIKGLQQGNLQELCVLSSIFSPLLKQDREVENLFYLRARQNPKMQAAISRELESLAEFPYFATISQAMNTERYQALFSLDSSRDWLAYYREKLQLFTETIAASLHDASVVNRSEPVYITGKPLNYELMENLSAITGFEQEPLFISLGSGRMLSGTRGRFAFNLDGMLLTPGIAYPFSKKGERCEFEKQCYGKFFDEVVLNDDPLSAINFIAEKARQLADYQVLPGELVCVSKQPPGIVDPFAYSFEAGRDFTDFSARARSGRINHAREQKSRKGESINYSYDYAQMYHKFFGVSFTSVVDDELPLETERTTKKGTISEIVEWLIPLRKSPEVAKLLLDLYTGQSTPESRVNLVNYIGAATKLEQLALL